MPVATSYESTSNSNGNGDISHASPSPSPSPPRPLSLPPELWATVLSHLPRSELQRTALALSRSLPEAGVTLKHLFSDIRITRDDQATQVIRRLGPRYPDAGSAKAAATSFTGLAWRTDSNILVNLVTAFPDLRYVVLHVGPLFAPEHLEELVELERPTLEMLALRFNPYVDKASYTIFLKGLYFDTGILRLARWPVTPSFKHLSLVQDPIPSYRELVAAAFEAGLSAPTKAYAQPIVFFKLSCLSTLSTSPISSHISNVRLRIPGRSILTAISTASTASSTVVPATHSATLPKPFPALEHLDISTTYVSCDAALQGLLKRHASMRYLVADRSGLIRYGMAEQTCSDIGKVIASIGVNRASEAMKVYRAAYRAQQARMQAQQERARQAAAAASSGVHTDAEYARQIEEEQNRNAEFTRAARRGRSAFATERRPRSAHVPLSSSANAELEQLNDALASLAVSSSHSKPVILPSAPSLISLACGVGGGNIDDELRQEWEEEFQEGFSEGLDRVVSTINEKLEEYNRLHTRARNATHKSSAEDRIFPKLVRFRTPEERKVRLVTAAKRGISVEDLDGENKDILTTLDLVECDVAEAMELIDQVKQSGCTLCTIPDCAGEGRIAQTEHEGGEGERKLREKWRRPESEHKVGCGHLVGRGIWEEQE